MPLPLLHADSRQEVYHLDDRHVVIVATDLPGELRTRLAAFWFGQTRQHVPNHLVSTNVDDLPLSSDERAAIAGRAMICRRADPLEVGCIIRGYLAGDAWADYEVHGKLAGEWLPAGLRRGDRLPEPRFTPTVPTEDGREVGVTRVDFADYMGEDTEWDLELASDAVFRHAAELAARAGILLAEARFTFGYIDGELSLLGHLLTPETARYWDAAAAQPGQEPAPFIPPPGDDLQRYRALLDRLTGASDEAMT